MLGFAWPGLAWRGVAWPGVAWPGLAWLGCKTSSFLLIQHGVQLDYAQ